jgi:glycogen operon protein
VGGFPSEWSEWNDAYRKTLRCFWRGDAGQVPELGRRLTASADIYQHRGRAPRASVNHVTVHDGFTLADLVSYENKHNEANGEDNRDGSSENFSINCGVEGPTDDPAILEQRRKLRRAQLASLILAQGVPLMLAGDEVGNSQGGNNNAYCQDSEIGWTDWSGLGRDGDDLVDFVGQLTGLRRRYPQLKPRHWLNGKLPDGSRDIVWLTPGSTEMNEADWNFAEGRFLSYVLAPVEGSPGPLFIVLNAAAQEIEFTLPKYRQVSGWHCELATVPLQQGDGQPFAPGGKCIAPASSVTVFTEAT